MADDHESDSDASDPDNSGSLADLADAISETSDAAYTGKEQSDRLSKRDNKPVNRGFVDSMDSTYDITTLRPDDESPSIEVKQDKSAIGFIRFEQDAEKQSFIWIGKHMDDVSKLYVVLWAVKPDTGDLHRLLESDDLSDQISDEWAYNVYNVGEIEAELDESDDSDADTTFSGIPVSPGDLLGVEVRVQGSGTYKIAGNTYKWMTMNFPNVLPRRLAATRNSGVSDSPKRLKAPDDDNKHGDYEWTNEAPWFGSGDDMIPMPNVEHQKITKTYTSADNYTYKLPTWWHHLDVFVLSGGQGGSGGNSKHSGRNGKSGVWETHRFTRDDDGDGEGDFKVNITVGKGGKGGAGTRDSRKDGVAGAASSVRFSGESIRAHGNGDHRDAGDKEFHGHTVKPGSNGKGGDRGSKGKSGVFGKSGGDGDRGNPGAVVVVVRPEG